MFESVCGVGFQDMAQGLIDTSAQAGRVDTLQLLPDPTTISHRLTEIRRGSTRKHHSRAEDKSD